MEPNIHEQTHRRFYGWRMAGWIILAVLGAVLFSLIFGYFVMLLWNWLFPALFGWKTITYLQAFGLLVIAKLFFGSFGRPPRPRWHRRMRHNAPDWDWGNGEDWSVQGGWRQWKYYRDYWKTEGKAAFEKYLEKMNAPEEPRKE